MERLDLRFPTPSLHKKSRITTLVLFQASTVDAGLPGTKSNSSVFSGCPMVNLACGLLAG